MTKTDGTDLIRRLYARLEETGEEATASGVTVGERVVLVELDHPNYGRLAGVAHRPPGPSRDSWPENGSSIAALAMDEPTGASSETKSYLTRAVGIATLNALSTPFVNWRTGDPMAAIDDSVGVISTVGLFRPAFRKFADVAVRVVEREPPASVTAPEDVTVETFLPDACEDAFEGADLCFITGSTLVYGGLERYLSALERTDVPLVVLVGATASFLPELAFDAGIDLMAGARVTDVPTVRSGARAGDCGTDLHDSGLEKVYAARTSTLPGLSLNTARTNDSDN